MKKTWIAVLIIIVVIGSTWAFITVMNQNNELKRLEEANKVGQLTKEDLETVQQNQSEKIKNLTKENQRLEVQIQELTEKAKDIEKQVGFKEYNIESLKQELDYYEARVKIDNVYNSKDYDQVINYKDIEVGDMIEGMKVTRVEKYDVDAFFSFDGYYILKGVISKDLLGIYSFSFTPEKDDAKKIFDHIIDFGELKLSFKAFGINEDEVLKQSLGEEVYNKFEVLLKEGIEQEVEIVGIFKGYNIREREGSIYVNTAKLIQVLEVGEIRERPNQ